MAIKKQKGFGLSSLLYLTAFSLLASYSIYQIYAKNTDSRVKLNYSLNERVRALRDLTLMHYASSCEFGEVDVDDLKEYGLDSFGLAPYGVDNANIYIKESPRPHFQIVLNFHKKDQVIISSLMSENATVSADKLNVMIKLPLNFSHSSNGALLLKNSHLNEQGICT